MNLNSGDGLINFGTVPVNKRLVIEHAALSIQANAPNGFSQVLIPINGASDAISCTLIGQVPSVGYQTFACTTQTNLYAETGQSLYIEATLGDFVGYSA